MLSVHASSGSSRWSWFGRARARPASRLRLRERRQLGCRQRGQRGRRRRGGCWWRGRPDERVPRMSRPRLHGRDALDPRDRRLQRGHRRVGPHRRGRTAHQRDRHRRRRLGRRRGPQGRHRVGPVRRAQQALRVGAAQRARTQVPGRDPELGVPRHADGLERKEGSPRPSHGVRRRGQRRRHRRVRRPRHVRPDQVAGRAQRGHAERRPRQVQLRSRVQRRNQLGSHREPRRRVVRGLRPRRQPRPLGTRERVRAARTAQRFDAAEPPLPRRWKGRFHRGDRRGRSHHQALGQRRRHEPRPRPHGLVGGARLRSQRRRHTGALGSILRTLSESPVARRTERQRRLVPESLGGFGVCLRRGPNLAGQPVRALLLPGESDGHGLRRGPPPADLVHDAQLEPQHRPRAFPPRRQQRNDQLRGHRQRR
jgi:hypothetical protein